MYMYTVNISTELLTSGNNRPITATAKKSDKPVLQVGFEKVAATLLITQNIKKLFQNFCCQVAIC